MRRRASIYLGMFCALLLCACGDDDSDQDSASEAGSGVGAAGSESSVAGAGSGAGTAGAESSATELPADFFTPPAAAFSSTDDAPRTVQVSASGEVFGQTLFSYTNPPPEGAPVFVDGWQIEFTRYLVVIDSVSLNEPGSDPDVRDALGSVVVEQRGPWVVDLHKAGPIVGAGGPPETAVPLTVLSADFDTSRTYAVSYETGPASYELHNTNLTDTDRDALLEMIEHGWVKYVEGEATYLGRTPSETVDSSFLSYPTRVHFAFGLADPARYVNCHNPEIGEEDEPKNRGVRPAGNGAVRAQLTFHTDHMFWDQADVEGTPLRFDALAARVQGFGSDAALHELTLDELVGVSPSNLTDQSGAPVRDRGDQTTGYEPGPVAPPTYGTQGISEITDLRSFVAYNNRAQGHLNSDGLCAVVPTGTLAF